MLLGKGVVDVHDVGMVELRQDRSLLLEAQQGIEIDLGASQDQLGGYLFRSLPVIRFENPSHRAGPDLALQLQPPAERAD